MSKRKDNNNDPPPDQPQIFRADSLDAILSGRRTLSEVAEQGTLWDEDIVFSEEDSSEVPSEGADESMGSQQESSIRDESMEGTDTSNEVSDTSTLSLEMSP